MNLRPHPERKIARVARALPHQEEPSSAGQTRFSSLVAAPGHGGLISKVQGTAVLSAVSAGHAQPLVPKLSALIARPVKCSPEAPPSSTDTALTIGLPEHTSRSPPPSTSTNALRHPTSAPYLHPHQHSRSNPTHTPLLSVVPLPSSRTIQLQHTTAMHQGCVCCAGGGGAG